MDRLLAETRRLYLPRPDTDAGAEPTGFVDAQGCVRALVVAAPIGGPEPAGWALLSRVWQGVQADWGWPAPAIAVDGRGSFQLWFSLAQPVPVVRAQAFVRALCHHHLAELPPGHAALLGLPAADAALPGGARHADRVPALQPDTGMWSAFVAQDLAPVFAEQPWLDTPPNPDGQALLLARLQRIPPQDFQRIELQLQPATAATPAAAGATIRRDPQAFLLDVMNDDSAPLALRVDAAKALLLAAVKTRS